jgi:phospholipase/lecithinase/hemolysin
MSVKTQGTAIYFVSGPTASVKMACPTGVSGLGGAADQIENTCLDALTDRTYTRGLGNPGQVSVPFNLIPTDASHQQLFTLKDAGETIQWIVCLSDGSAEPTVVGSAFVAPASRTSFIFNAYISDVNIDVATNEIVRGTLTLQRSGAVVATWDTV